LFLLRIKTRVPSLRSHCSPSASFGKDFKRAAGALSASAGGAIVFGFFRLLNAILEYSHGLPVSRQVELRLGLRSGA